MFLDIWDSNAVCKTLKQRYVGNIYIKIISTSSMNKQNFKSLTKYLKRNYLKDAQTLGYSLADLLDIKTRAKIIKEIERGDHLKPIRVLSKRYLNDAKKLGYKW